VRIPIITYVLFLHLKSLGIDLQNITVFSDRGKQFNARDRLLEYDCNWLNLRSCTYHLAKNVCGKFSVGDLSLRNYLYRLSLNDYIKILNQIYNEYGKISHTSKTINQMVEGSIMLYLLKINPRQYSIVGNTNISLEEAAMMEFVWGSCANHKNMPCSGSTSTNSVEGENYAYICNGLRHQSIINAVITFISHCCKIKNKLEEVVSKYSQKEISVLRKASDIIGEERNKLSNTVLRCRANQQTYNVVRNGEAHLVNLDDKSCFRCTVRQQLELPCNHVMSVLVHLGNLEILPYVHQSYLVDTLMEHLKDADIEIPPNYKLLLPYSTKKFYPPPYYNYKGPVNISNTNEVFNIVPDNIVNEKEKVKNYSFR
jgi:hypothetical protein